ncbi:hydroxyacylglutathione hydrolase [Roseibaca sp. Y0-43]|uniref:hydroxyacylglutathione hydrolase n=1 Tax=Roseibaca sp. Y0-43 TaxID=2816854 RepID=UPI001D0C2D60|nr:hydroxyacylglutathione hydrolase [Roseibaca sp. Y0-43]MCC1480684.1 hydroxyacylglutathione hydrolase [Roseibaca sp. Y0-43]
MPLELLALRCLSDNYAYLLHDAVSGQTAVVDVPEAGPVFAALADTGWALSHILITHHHNDHIGGVEELRAATGAEVWGAKADAHRLPPLDLALAEGDRVAFGGEEAEILDVSGHTIGHIAFHFPQSALVFTADSLMALGCGRLFEGTADQMWTSLSKLTALPDQTRVCSGHDYLAGNAAFAQSVDAANPALAARMDKLDEMRAKGEPMAIATIAEEKATNPFLRASDPQMKAALGMAGASDAKAFAELRARKDRF